MTEEPEELKEMSLAKNLQPTFGKLMDDAMQFDWIRLDSGPYAGEIIPLTSLISIIKPYTGKKLAYEFSKILKGHN